MNGSKPWIPPNRDASRAVAANMRLLRKKRGWTQEELGERLGGWSMAAVSAAERSVDGKRVKIFDIDEICQLADLFDVTVADLITPIPPCRCCGDEPPPGMQCQVCGASGPDFSANGDGGQ